MSNLRKGGKWNTNSRNLEKTMDYVERDKREEEAPLIEAGYQNHLVDDEILFTQEQ